MRPRRQHFGYKPPGRDSARAKANAALFLIGARSLEGVTADAIARQYRLKSATALQLLQQEVERRAQ